MTLVRNRTCRQHCEVYTRDNIDNKQQVLSERKKTMNFKRKKEKRNVFKLSAKVKEIHNSKLKTVETSGKLAITSAFPAKGRTSESLLSVTTARKSNMSHEVPEHNRPRLCHVVKWPHFQGYGFSLHAEKGKAGQFIGKIDEGSPAEAAGLKDGDRIVEVNGVNIGNENHQQVVTRIKSGGEETRLLVVDEEADNWYKNAKKIIRGDLPEVRFISSKLENDDQEEPTGGQELVNGDDDAEDSYAGSRRESSAESAAPLSNGGTANEDASYRPRLCHLKYWAHFEGYGFNLHAEKGKPGQFIGLVDDNSPSSTAGLKVNDRIIEVNGVNVEQEDHIQVIARIKAIRGETRLLVVDKETDVYYQKKGVTVTPSMPQTDYLVTPDSPDAVPVVKTETRPSAEPIPQFTPPPPARLDSVSSTTRPTDDLELNLSVAEMKERLKAKKKQDPRLNKIPFEEKFKEFQRM